MGLRHSFTTWRRSSYSSEAGNCVEVAFSDTTWRTSSYSGASSNCVEVAFAEPAVGVRDSKRPDAGTLVLRAASWSELLRRMR